MKIDIFGRVRDALEENAIKIKAIERDNTCVRFELDFSEHDKEFEDKIARLECSYHKHRSKICALESENQELKQRIAELEGNGTENVVEVKTYATPIEIATHLINNTCTINELKMIAEHINVYCNGGK